MRTTVTIAPDVASEVERLRREKGLGPSAAINHLARQGMARPDVTPGPYVHVSAPIGLRIDVSDIGEVLDALDGTE